MADYETIRAGRVGARPLAIDEGLRAHMNKVYGLMSVGMLLTGLVAWAVGSQPALIQAIFGTPLKWVVMFAPLVVVFAFGAMLNRMSAATAQLVFYAYAALMGLSISFIFAVYTGVSIAQTFLVTAIAFAGLSLYGYTTKRDLSGMGTFLLMGLIGLIVASIINIFLQSPGLYWAVSALGVLIFAGLTAYDTQKLKVMGEMAPADDATAVRRGTILGALNLYLDFINLVLMMLRLFGGGNRD